MNYAMRLLSHSWQTALGGLLLACVLAAPLDAQPLRGGKKGLANQALPKESQTQSPTTGDGALASENAKLVERLSAMPPEQRKRLLERMAPQRRALIERRLEQYNAIKPEDRIKLKKAYEDFQNLPLEKQAEARQIFRDVADLEPARRQQVRAAIARLRTFSGRELEQRLNGRVFQERFNAAERALITQALQVLPPLAKDAPTDPQ